MRWDACWRASLVAAHAGRSNSNRSRAKLRHGIPVSWPRPIDSTDGPKWDRSHAGRDRSAKVSLIRFYCNLRIDTLIGCDQDMLHMAPMPLDQFCVSVLVANLAGNSEMTPVGFEPTQLRASGS